ncbi:MAG: hypothetical protein LBF61_12550 [Azoarcus sp.]|jgi:hypothetical protein|nr:hypothetical protein [Azoarcus sp.]
MFLVNKGSKALVIERSYAMAQVRILEGIHEGKSGWVSVEFAVKQEQAASLVQTTPIESTTIVEKTTGSTGFVAAQDFIERLDTDVEIIRTIVEMDSASMGARSRKMMTFSNEGMAFTGGPLSNCYLAGAYAYNFWMSRISPSSAQTPEQALDAYDNAAEQCKEQISKKPKKTITVRASVN